MGHSSRNHQNPWLNAIATLPITDRRLLKQVPLKVRRSSGWFLCGLSGTALLAWNAPLVCATGAGMGTMLAVYTVKAFGSWDAALAELQKTLKHLPPRLLISVLSGLGATVGTAGIFSLWQSSDNPAMAAGSIAQGLITTGILGLLVWQQWQRSPQIKNLAPLTPSSFDDWLRVLHSPEPIDRIQAIHQLHRQGDRTTELLDYLRYLQDQDPDAQVRQVAYAIAQQLQPAELTPSQQPLHQISMEDLTLFATNLHAIER